MPNKIFYLFISSLIFCFFGILSCDNSNSMDNTADPEINLEFLHQTWFWSYEEDGLDAADDVRTYRPDSYGFPPSLGRGGFTILETQMSDSQVLIGYGIAPYDSTIITLGSWYIQDDNDGNFLVSFFKDCEGQEVGRGFGLEIVELTSNLMRAKFRELRIR